MKKEYILFIDSGVGGLSTLCEVYKVLPANYIYFADNKNAPYGNHTHDKIYEFVKEIIESVSKKYLVKMVVLACNTATTSSIKRLRSKFQTIKFVGTEPAIKLAYNKNNKRILSVVTPATSSQTKYKHLVSSLDAYIKNLPLKTFAKSIEDYYSKKQIWANFLMQKNIYTIAQKAKNFDCVVLGCTHYILAKDKICKIANLSAFDGNFGVSKQVLFWHAKIYNNFEINPHIKFLVSDKNKSTSQNYKKIFYEILAKV